MVSEENPESSKVKELPGFFYSNIQLMNEINFYDVIQFVSGYTAEEKIITYAILGGIPHYLKQFDGFKSYQQTKDVVEAKKEYQLQLVEIENIMLK